MGALKPHRTGHFSTGFLSIFQPALTIGREWSETERSATSLYGGNYSARLGHGLKPRAYNGKNPAEAGSGQPPSGGFFRL